MLHSQNIIVFIVIQHLYERKVQHCHGGVGEIETVEFAIDILGVINGMVLSFSYRSQQVLSKIVACTAIQKPVSLTRGYKFNAIFPIACLWI
jgi:hypothetical protein